MAEDNKRVLIRRFMKVREQLLRDAPFYGSLVMHLKFGLAPCETAYTDMRHIVFDPQFMQRLSDEELRFVVEHEVLHCVLLHCVRGKNLNPWTYNIACDIVVNSNILYGMNRGHFSVDGESVMHLAPNGQEGYLYTAEQVYDMICDKQAGLELVMSADTAGLLDNHEIWKKITEIAVLEDAWTKTLLEAGAYGMGACPPSVREVLMDLQRPSRVNWREILQDFIQIHHDRFDYSFVPPDRRFIDFEFFLPSFQEEVSAKIENLWFCVDASGSMSNEILQMVYSEIGHAVMQLGELKGLLSFFDTHVTEPIPFESVEMLQKIPVLGGGGTSFGAIFRYLKEYMRENPPTAIVILTDGYAPLPDESDALGIPVLWVLTQPEVTIDWGTVIYLQ